MSGIPGTRISISKTEAFNPDLPATLGWPGRTSCGNGCRYFSIRSGLLDSEASKIDCLVDGTLR